MDRRAGGGPLGGPSHAPGPCLGGLGGQDAAQGLGVQPAVALFVVGVGLAAGAVGDGGELLPDLRGVLAAAACAQRLAVGG